jgi:hypothetical protein
LRDVIAEVGLGAGAIGGGRLPGQGLRGVAGRYGNRARQRCEQQADEETNNRDCGFYSQDILSEKINDRATSRAVSRIATPNNCAASCGVFIIPRKRDKSSELTILSINHNAIY